MLLAFFQFHLSILPAHLFRACLEYAMNVRGEKFNRMYRAKSPNVVYSGGTLTNHLFSPSGSRHFRFYVVHNCAIVFLLFHFFLFYEFRYMKHVIYLWSFFI